MVVPSLLGDVSSSRKHGPIWPVWPVGSNRPGFPIAHAARTDRLNWRNYILADRLLRRQQRMDLVWTDSDRLSQCGMDEGYRYGTRLIDRDSLAKHLAKRKY